eukprot:1349836-Pleurochrysis_carterae.AAC.8
MADSAILRATAWEDYHGKSGCGFIDTRSMVVPCIGKNASENNGHHRDSELANDKRLLHACAFSAWALKKKRRHILRTERFWSCAWNTNVCAQIFSVAQQQDHTRVQFAETRQK